VFATSKQIKTGALAGANPDITLPKPARVGKVQAILFADVSKSMVLHERLGDRQARAVIDMLLGLAGAAVRSYGGRVVKTIGDEILAVMPDADAAARAGCDLLQKVHDCPPQGDLILGMHVGFHAGAFIERAGDVFGDAVNIASRLTAYAKPGQILTSSVSAPGISALVRRSMRPLGTLDIRGKRDEMHVEEIGWLDSDGEDTTVTEAMLRSAHVASTRLVLALGKRQWIAGPEAKHFAIGRDPCSDVLIRSPEASRNHGIIEYRNGGFFYSDKSLNGSFVSFKGASESLVRRSQILLSGQGVICFGHSVGELTENCDPLRFHVESSKH
jgi:class 3 adenylate cyclase